MEHATDAPALFLPQDLQDPFVGVAVVDDDRQGEFGGHDEKTPEDRLLHVPRGAVPVEIQPDLADGHVLRVFGGKLADDVVGPLRDPHGVMGMHPDRRENTLMGVGQLAGPPAGFDVPADRQDAVYPRSLGPGEHGVEVGEEVFSVDMGMCVDK